VFATNDHKALKIDNKTIGSFSVFKQGIEPVWEDPVNALGGEFYTRRCFLSIFRIYQLRSIVGFLDLDAQCLNLIWENLLLGLIGETMDPDNYICGVRVADKTNRNKSSYKIEIWLSTTDQAIRYDVEGYVLDTLKDVPIGKKALEFSWKEHSH